MNAILQIFLLEELRQLDERLAEEIERPVATGYLPVRVEARREIAAELVRRKEDTTRRIEANRAETEATWANAVLED